MERRFLTNEQTTLNDRTVKGYALVFNSYSKDLGGFKEIIDSRALDGVLEISDVLCLLNHNDDRGVLARSDKGVGSLKLTIDEKGLLYEFEAPKTALGDELIEGIKRGDIKTSSFAFTIDKEVWNSDYTERRIMHIKQLYDVSPVYYEAYPDTSVAIKNRNQKLELDKYYLELENKL